MSRARELNNRAAAALERGDWDAAATALDQCAALLAPADDFDATLDEYFYRCHRVRLAWARGEAPLADARRAAELEDAIDRFACARGQRDQFGYGHGAWSLISVATRAARLDEAEAALATALADGERFAARLRYNADTAEQVLVAGLCIFFERDLARARPLVARIGELVAQPRNRELLYGLACYHARMGERGAALDRLEQALARGYDRAHAAADADLTSLQGDPRFARAIAPPGRALDRHAEATHAHHPSSDDARLSMSVLAERARMEADARTIPDAAARAATRAFLGDWRRGRIEWVRATTYGLGEARIAVDGATRRVSVREETFGSTAKARERARVLDVATIEALFNAFVEQAFTEIVIAPHTGVPDELHFRLALTGAAGRTHTLAKFVQTPHRRFDLLVQLVGDLVRREKI